MLSQLQLERISHWTAALRSGEYKQGHVYLNNGDEFCCLGVAVEVAIKDGAVVNVERSNTVTKYDGDKCNPPQLLERWYGLRLIRDSRGESLDNAGWDLIDRNDLYMDTFPQIADYIDANLNHLFLSEEEFCACQST